MAQFSPIYFFFVYVCVWLVFLLMMVLLWWTGKRHYSF